MKKYTHFARFKQMGRSKRGRRVQRKTNTEEGRTQRVTEKDLRVENLRASFVLRSSVIVFSRASSPSTTSPAIFR